MAFRFTLPGVALLAVLIAGAAWFTVSGSSADTIASEPNNDFASCTPVSIGDTINDAIDPAGDVDYYCFTGTAGQTIAGDIDSAQAGDPPFDSVLTLYDDDQHAIANNDDHDGFDSYLEKVLPYTGQYYLRVRSNYSCCGGPEYAYTLRIISLAAPATPTPLPIDDPDNCPTIQPGAVINDAIDPEGDRDYYCFNGNAGQTIIADIDAMEIGSLLDPVLTLFDNEGEDLVRSDDVDGFDPYIEYVLPYTGEYYLRVEAFEHPYSGGPAYTYTLIFSKPGPTPAPTNTPRPPTPTPTGGLAGDSNCDGRINSIDAALALQIGASLANNLPCESLADVNEDGTVNSIDAALILQYGAGLLDHLPV
jgi:hypothetical protein